MSCYIAKVDENGKKVFDCNDSSVVECLIKTLKKASLEGDKKTIARCANELEGFKLLCGSNPLLETFERELAFTASKVGLESCQQVVRALAPTQEQKAEAEKMYTMIGYDVVEITKEGKTKLPDPPKPQPTIQRELLDCEIALAHRDIEDRKRQTKPKKSVTKNILKPNWREL